MPLIHFLIVPYTTNSKVYFEQETNYTLPQSIFCDS